LSKKGLTGIPSLLARALRPDVLKRLRATQIARRWEQVVGQKLFEKSRPDRIDGGTLWVAVKGASWAQELRMRKDEILERLNELAGERLFKDVRFGVRPLPQTDSLEQQEDQAPLEPAEVEVTISEPELEEAAVSALGRLRAASQRQNEGSGT
jgi:hypothetical protein